MRLNLFALFLILVNAAFAQKKIEGTYFADQHQFKSEDNSIWVDLFDNGVANYYQNGLTGLVDSNGRILIPAKYHFIENYKGNFAVVRKGYEKTLVNRSGDEVFPIGISEFYFDSNDFFRVKQHYEIRMYHSDGAPLNDFTYDYLGPFINDRATFCRGTNFGWLKPDGTEIILIEDMLVQSSDHPITYFHAGAALKYKRFQLCPLFELTEGLALTIAAYENGFRYGAVDKNSEIVIPIKYECLYPAKEGWIVAKDDNKFGVLNLKGAEVIPFEYDTLFVHTEDQFSVRKRKQSFFINTANESTDPKKKAVEASVYPPEIKIHPYLYHPTSSEVADSIPVSENLIKKARYGKWGLVDTKGRVVLKYRHDLITWLSTDSVGIAVLYESSYPLPTGVPRYQYNGSFYFFDQNGRIGDETFPFSKRMEMEGNYDPSQVTKNHFGHHFLPNDFSQELRIVKSKKTNPPDYIEPINDYFSVIGDILKKSHSLYSGAYTRSYIKGIITADGNYLFEKEFDGIDLTKRYTNNSSGSNNPKNLILVTKGQKSAVINLFGEIVIPFNDQYISFYAGLIEVTPIIREDGEADWDQSSLYDLNGNLLVPLTTTYGESLIDQWIDEKK